MMAKNYSRMPMRVAAQATPDLLQCCQISTDGVRAKLSSSYLRQQTVANGGFAVMKNSR